MTQETFHSSVWGLEVTGSTRLELEKDQFLRWNITSLISLDMPRNNITKIWQRAFCSLTDLKYLKLDDNRITTLDSQTFYYNTRLVGLSLSRNSITDIHPTTFQENMKLEDISLDCNKFTSLHPDVFKNNVELETVNLTDNRITDIHPSTFRNNRRLKFLDISRNKITLINPSTFRNDSRLRHLDISRNKITSLNPDTFIHNRKLTFLYLQGNNITEISNSSFRGLEQLEELDLSNNNIQELNPLVFHNTLNSTNRQNHQVSKLKHIHLEQNKIRSFKFELYFPTNSNSDSSNPIFKLEYLNISSNLLTTLDVASVKWLNQTTAVTDLTANPWNCDCSVLLEVWRGLKHKLTLYCASPIQFQGNSWEVMEEFCSKVAEDRKSNTSSEAVSTSTQRNYESEVSTQSEGPTVVKITLIVTGVLLVWQLFGV